MLISELTILSLLSNVLKKSVDAIIMQIVILIPAYKPTLALITLVQEISTFAHHIFIINDGSGPQYQEIFCRLAEHPKVTIIHHAINLGKGQALKTGFNAFLTQFAKDCPGLVTADADGQHLSQDIKKVAINLFKDPHTLWLGKRTFESRQVPFRSRFGNILTRLVFRGLLKQKISDTQTGLRGIPKDFLPPCLKSQTTGYDFELDMLVKAGELEVPIKEIPITTVYENNNASSHFNPIIDSVKIYLVFFRFLMVAILSGLLDFIIFSGTFMAFNQLLLSETVARIFSSSFNFTCNKGFVFKSRQKILPEALKYTLLCLINLVFSYSLIFSFIFFGINVYISKIFVLFGLFIANFAVQRLLVFNREGSLPVTSK